MTIVRGIRWPFQSGSDSFPQMSSGPDVIRDSLIQIVTTQLGERRMRPTYGLNSFGYVWEDVTPIAAARIARDTRKAITENEPRATVVSVEVSQNTDPGKPGFLIHIVYYANSEYNEIDIPVAA